MSTDERSREEKTSTDERSREEKTSTDERSREEKTSTDERSREEKTGSDVKLGYIGLGNQGAPMAKRLADWPGGLVVFDVRTEAMTPLV
ncbi:MAG: oxidoreductase, partial [Mycobacterium sp.]|nr:oxidoreductase [Mycobacterium sp.]